MNHYTLLFEIETQVKGKNTNYNCDQITSEDLIDDIEPHCLNKTASACKYKIIVSFFGLQTENNGIWFLLFMHS